MLLNYFELDSYIEHRVQKIFILNYIELFSAGICFYKYKSRTYSNFTHIIMLLSIASLFFSYSYEDAILISCFYFVFAMIIVGKARILRAKLLVYLGAISYSLYLIHQNVGYVIIYKMYSMEINPLLSLCTALVCSFLLAHIILVFVERPSLDLSLIHI